MSCGLIFQTQNDIFIAADTAASINFNETIYRKDENAKKLFVFDKMVVFCTGHLDFSYSLMDKFSKSDMKIDTLQRIAKDNFLKTYGNDFTLGKLDIMIGTFLDDGKSVVYQISPYEQFEIIMHRIPTPMQFGFWSGGIMVDKALEIAYAEFSRTMNIIPTFQKTYDDISFEGVGGDLIIYNINSAGVRKLYQSPIKEKDIKHLDYNDIIKRFLGNESVQLINANVVRGLLGEFATLRAGQIILNDDGSGLSEIGIKVTHADGSYTSMEYNGFERFIVTPIYNYEQTGNSNIEDFTTHYSKALLIADGWEFSQNVDVVSNELVIGSATINESSGRVYRYITKKNTSFNFTYRTFVDSGINYYFILDNTVYKLAQSATNTTFQATNGAIELSEGWHTFQWVSSPQDILDVTKNYIYVDNIVFESDVYSKKKSGTKTTGSSYNYLVHTDTGSTSTYMAAYEDAIPDKIIQLPDEFKGKQFKVNVFLQDTNKPANEYKDYAINKILIEVVKNSIDYENATFKVRAVISKVSKPSTLYQGCDFAYIAIA